MDAMTERHWEEEFARQYPDVRWVPSGGQALFWANVATDVARKHALIKLFGRYKELPFMNGFYAPLVQGVMQWNAHIEASVQSQLSLKHLQKARKDRLSAYNQWREECRARFDAIFTAEPIHALEQLKQGNLFIN